MAKTLQVFISVANIIMGLLMFLCSLTVLLSLVAVRQSYQGYLELVFGHFIHRLYPLAVHLSHWLLLEDLICDLMPF
jgi:hypothetical protein